MRTCQCAAQKKVEWGLARVTRFPIEKKAPQAPSTTFFPHDACSVRRDLFLHWCWRSNHHLHHQHASTEYQNLCCFKLQTSSLTLLAKLQPEFGHCAYERMGIQDLVLYDVFMLLLVVAMAHHSWVQISPPKAHIPRWLRGQDLHMPKASRTA